MNILFDLDGTLTDSAEGILNSVRLVFSTYHIPIPSEKDLQCFIGPPLEVTFPKFGIPPDQVQDAIAVFRSRYIPIGKFENRPYKGIPEMLKTLKSQGHALFVATSKPEQTAREILNHFHLDHYFEGICGATQDSSRISKSQVITYLLKKYPCSVDNLIMVGDTTFDAVGAASLGIQTIGVAWGYGSRDELAAAGANPIADTPEQIPEFIQSYFISRKETP